MVIRIAPDQRTPVWPKESITGTAKYLLTAINPVTRDKINIGSAQLYPKITLIHCSATNSDIAVKDIHKNKKIKTGLPIALKFSFNERSSAILGLGNLCPKKSNAYITVGIMIIHI